MEVFVTDAELRRSIHKPDLTTKRQTETKQDRSWRHLVLSGLTVRRQGRDAQLLLLLLLLEHGVGCDGAQHPRARTHAPTTLQFQYGDQHLAVAGLQGRIGQLLVQVLRRDIANFQTFYGHPASKTSYGGRKNCRRLVYRRRWLYTCGQEMAQQCFA